MTDFTTKARAAEWGHVHLARGKVLCMRLDTEKVVLVEPEGGYMYLSSFEVDPTPMPEVKELACALTDLSADELSAVSEFCSQPKTMQEIEDAFPDIEAWRLRRLGLLRDVGKKGRRIISQWAGYDLDHLVRSVYDMAERGTRNINNPPPPVEPDQ